MVTLVDRSVHWLAMKLNKDNAFISRRVKFSKKLKAVCTCRSFYDIATFMMLGDNFAYHTPIMVIMPSIDK